MAVTTATSTPTRGLTDAKAGGMAMIAGAVSMVIGTVFWLQSGTDIDHALENDAMGEYLIAASEHGTVLTANLGLWMLGVILLGLGGVLMARLGDHDSPTTTLATYAFTLGPAAAIVFFSMWLGIVLGLAPAYVDGQSVEPIAVAAGYATTVADWVVTVVIVAVGGAALALSGRTTWAPRWLVRWAMLTLAAGFATLLGVVFDVRSMLAGPVVPIGLVLLLGIGVQGVRTDAEMARATIDHA